MFWLSWELSNSSSSSNVHRVMQCVRDAPSHALSMVRKCLQPEEAKSSTGLNIKFVLSSDIGIFVSPCTIKAANTSIYGTSMNNTLHTTADNISNLSDRHLQQVFGETLHVHSLSLAPHVHSLSLTLYIGAIMCVV